MFSSFFMASEGTKNVENKIFIKSKCLFFFFKEKLLNEEKCS